MKHLSEQIALLYHALQQHHIINVTMDAPDSKTKESKVKVEILKSPTERAKEAELFMAKKRFEEANKVVNGVTRSEVISEANKKMSENPIRMDESQ